LLQIIHIARLPQQAHQHHTVLPGDGCCVGLGPEHDFSSHAADAFGLMAICYEGPDGPQTIDELFERQRQYADTTRSEITGY
jgi:hypothetical protein